MMPSPDQGASHGRQPDPRSGDQRPPVAHLLCRCQRGEAVRVAICGTTVRDPVAYVGAVPAVDACVVCLDLGRSTLVADRCSRCRT